MRQARIRPRDEDTFGSDLFVKTVVARVRGEAAVQRRRLVRALGSDPAAPPPIYSFKQLRRIV